MGSNQDSYYCLSSYIMGSLGLVGNTVASSVSNQKDGIPLHCKKVWRQFRSKIKNLLSCERIFIKSFFTSISSITLQPNSYKSSRFAITHHITPVEPQPPDPAALLPRNGLLAHLTTPTKTTTEEKQSPSMREILCSMTLSPHFLLHPPPPTCTTQET